MSAVFSHGRLRLYLLKLLDEGGRHGYELIRLLENRFHGLYAPSAGTIYPRLARMEADGLITHTASGGRKVYEITDLGRAELRRRSVEVAELESEIHASVADLADLAEEIEAGVRGSVRDLKRELRQATRDARGSILDGVPGVEDWADWRDSWRGPDARGRRSAGDREDAFRPRTVDRRNGPARRRGGTQGRRTGPGGQPPRRARSGQRFGPPGGRYGARLDPSQAPPHPARLTPAPRPAPHPSTRDHGLGSMIGAISCP
jgi:DNA-binding PadR family transcriptional regulator